MKIRLAYLDSRRQEVTSASVGRGFVVMLIVSVGMVVYGHALSPSPDIVGKLPLVSPPPSFLLQQWQKAEGSALGLPSNASP